MNPSWNNEQEANGSHPGSSREVDDTVMASGVESNQSIPDDVHMINQNNHSHVSAYLPNRFDQRYSISNSTQQHSHNGLQNNQGFIGHGTTYQHNQWHSDHVSTYSTQPPTYPPIMYHQPHAFEQQATSGMNYYPPIMYHQPHAFEQQAISGMNYNLSNVANETMIHPNQSLHHYGQNLPLVPGFRSSNSRGFRYTYPPGQNFHYNGPVNPTHQTTNEEATENTPISTRGKGKDSSVIRQMSDPTINGPVNPTHQTTNKEVTENTPISARGKGTDSSVVRQMSDPTINKIIGSVTSNSTIAQNKGERFQPIFQHIAGTKILPEMELSRPDTAIPSRIEMRGQMLSNHLVFLACFYHKPSTTTKKKYVGSEEVIMDLFRNQNYLSKNNTTILNPRCLDSGITVQKIQECKCRGKSKGTCNLCFAWFRCGEYLCIYANVPKNMTNPSTLKHQEGCDRTKALLPPRALQAVKQTKFDRHGATRVLSWMKKDHSLCTDKLDLRSSRDWKRAKISLENAKHQAKKIANIIAPDEETTVADRYQWICENVMSVEEYCTLLKHDDPNYILNNLDQIVVLDHDFKNAKDLRWNGIVVTTVGRLLIWQKLIEMSAFKQDGSVTLQIDGAEIQGGVFSIHLCITDYLHKPFLPLFVIAREENLVASKMLLTVALKIVKLVGGEVERKFYLLKDGGRAFQVAATILLLNALACRLHMIEKGKGKGTKGYNQCGSLIHYNDGKKLCNSEYKLFIEWLNSNLFYMFNKPKEQRIVVLMFFKWLLFVWLPKESKSTLVVNLNEEASLDEVHTFVQSNYGRYRKYVENENYVNDAQPQEGNKFRKMDKCEKIITWYYAYYFPVDVFTYGSVHIPGDPFDTNGLEGANYKYQNETDLIRQDSGCSPFRGFIESIKESSLIPDTFQYRPYSDGKDWNKVFQYCRKKGKNNKANTPMPAFMALMVVYDIADGTLIPRKNMISRLASICTRKDSSHGLRVFLPTKVFLDTILDEVKEIHRQRDNIAGYEDSYTQDMDDPEQFMTKWVPLLYPFINRSLCELYETEGVPTGVPTITNISQYVFKHACRHEYKGNVAHLNRHHKNTDHQMDNILKNLLRALDSRVGANNKKREEQKKKRRVYFGGANHTRHMFQRGLGWFVIIDIRKDGTVASNDENFQRWGESFFTRFFKFLCFQDRTNFIEDEEQLMEHDIGEGLDMMRTYLIKHLNTHISEMIINEQDEHSHPPEKDPTKFKCSHNNNLD